MKHEILPKTPEPEIYEEGLFSSPFASITVLFLWFLLGIIFLAL